MDRLLDAFCWLIDRVIAVLLAVMVVLVFGNVVLRYAFNSGITVSEEVSRWLFVWMTFLGALVALKEHAHLGTDVLISRLPPAGRRLCLAVAQVLMLFTTGLLFSGSLAQVKINLDVEAPVTGASVAVFYAVGIAFAVPAALLLLRELWRTLSGRPTHDALEQARAFEDALAADRRPLDRTP